ncbi:unnamed protein product (macronuclear) [Paramecium tetraurelia]|uniref:Protein kinase domain-containing protein n=1 Tax=Paramecium tetraurelia TaxID=5888 RepID=A0BF47_PARTE|nr:uncharacterized protein GSPATT00028199001 [Paramecium tetraurelia]CAK57164.1 unnamed protein product [Paramecium tetraurelia]|eukprot:XP_001424562.1 hypothetical protein (macronuclear) [Paramecium tetraurelia strain d4-2]
MGVCTSSTSKNNQKQKQEETVTKINKQISLIAEQKNGINQFQENQRTITPRRRLSQNQAATPVQQNLVKNGTQAIRRASHATTMTTKTLIIQSSSIQEQQKTGSFSNLSYQRSNIRKGNKTLLVSASKNFSIVSSKNLDNQGKTVMQHNESGQLVQVEVLKFESKNHEYLQKLEEIKLVRILITQDNMHIVKIIDTLVDHHHKKTYQIMYECCAGGSLSKLLECRRLSDNTIGIILYQMIEALAYVHSLGLSHDELTIDSFSVFDDSSTPFIKLSDIRSIYQLMYPKEAQQYEDRPPQKHQNHKQKNKHHEASQVAIKTRDKSNDVWALAVIILQLRNKELPYEISKIHLFNPEEYLNNHPSEMNQLLIEMLRNNRNDRISLKKCLEHPYLIKMKQVQPQDLLQPLKNMVKCKNMTYVHKCLFSYFLHNYAHDHLKVLTKIFITADTNQDGSLSLEELKELFSIEGKDLIEQLDLQQELTLDEFLLLASNKEIILTEDNIESSFKLLSRQSNLVTQKSICKFVNNCNEQLIQQDFNTFNLHDVLDLKEYREFLINYETPIPIV